MTRLLEAEGLSVGGAEGPLPGPVDLHLDAGEVLAVEGPSGSGKTTLLRALSLLDARTAGSVRHRGQAPSDDRIPAFRRRVLYLPQRPPSFLGVVSEALARPFTFRAATGAFDAARARRLLETLHLPGRFLSRRHDELSEGEAQRVALVRALLLDPEILLLDEPTSALDPEATEAAERLLGAWLGEGERAAVLVSHLPEQRRRLATVRQTLDQGRLGPREGW